MNNTKFLLGAAAIALTLGFTANANAADQEIGATATFSTAVALTGAQDLDFGTISYTNASNGNITLGTNDTAGGTGGYSVAGGQAGEVVINGTTGSDVDIECDNTATLSDGTNTMPVTSIEYAIGTGAASGSGTACAGIDGTADGTHTIVAAAADNTVLIGATIDGSTAPAADGTYNTTNASGVSITFNVNYQ